MIELYVHRIAPYKTCLNKHLHLTVSYKLDQAVEKTPNISQLSMMHLVSLVRVTQPHICVHVLMLALSRVVKADNR